MALSRPWRALRTYEAAAIENPLASVDLIVEISTMSPNKMA